VAFAEEGEHNLLIDGDTVTAFGPVPVERAQVAAVLRGGEATSVNVSVVTDVMDASNSPAPIRQLPARAVA
jgi:hypothetical protein